MLGRIERLNDSVASYANGVDVAGEIMQRDGVDATTALFSESTARAIAVVPRSEELRFTDMCIARHVPVTRVGVVDGTGEDAVLDVQGLFSVSVAELRAAHEATLPARFA